MLYVSQPSNATKNVAQSINYKIKWKKSEFNWDAKEILGFERFFSKVRDLEKIASEWLITVTQASTVKTIVFNKYF